MGLAVSKAPGKGSAMSICREALILFSKSNSSKPGPWLSLAGHFVRHRPRQSEVTLSPFFVPGCRSVKHSFLAATPIMRTKTLAFSPLVNRISRRVRVEMSVVSWARVANHLPFHAFHACWPLSLIDCLCSWRADDSSSSQP